MTDEDNTKCCSRSWRESESLLLVVVTIGAFLDSMLISTVVPIFPNHLYQIEGINETEGNFSNQTEDFFLNLTRNNFLNETRYNTFNQTWNNVTESDSQIVQQSKMSLPANMTQNNFEISEKSVSLGVLFASKPFVQLLANPLVGRYANTYSYRKMMSLGFAIMFSSTLMFAFGVQYQVLIFARSLQGIASSFISVVGITALADRFTDEKKRANAIRIALAGLGIGLSVGPPFGGCTYQYLGKTSPFLILCIIIFLDTCLLALTAQPSSVKKKKEMKQTSFIKLIMDPYIMIVTGGVFLTCACYAIIEAMLPLIMKKNMESTSFEMGMVFVPYSICFFIITAVIGKFCLRLKRWLISAIGILITGISLIMFPFCQNVWQIFIPSSVMGVGAGVVDIALMPEIAHLVDLRHTSVYGNAFAIVDIAMCLGLTISPPFTGLLLQYIDFLSIMIGGSIICFVYVPLVYLLRDPPVKTSPQAPKELLEIKTVNVKSGKENDLS